jgi:hypothetical protein
MTPAGSWWPACAWSLDLGSRSHGTSVQQEDGFAGYAEPKKPKPALNSYSLGPAPDKEEAYMPRHPNRVETHARRLEDLLGFLGMQRARAHRRRERALLRAAEAQEEMREYDRLITDIRDSRSQRHPAGLRVVAS